MPWNCLACIPCAPAASLPRRAAKAGSRAACQVARLSASCRKGLSTLDPKPAHGQPPAPVPTDHVHVDWAAAGMLCSHHQTCCAERATWHYIPGLRSEPQQRQHHERSSRSSSTRPFSGLAGCLCEMCSPVQQHDSPVHTGTGSVRYRPAAQQAPYLQTGTGPKAVLLWRRDRGWSTKC